MKEIKEQIVLDILNDKLNKGIISPNEEAVEKQRLMSLVADEVSTQFLEQKGNIDAISMSKNMETIGVDIRVAFGVINDLDQKVIKHKKLNQASMANMNLAIKKTADRIAATEEKKRQLFGSSSYKETFRGQESFEPDVLYYKEREGSQQTQEAVCTFDKFNEEIHLPYSIQNNVVLGKDGVSFATARVVMQLGEDLTIESTDPNAMLDSSLLTSWKVITQTNEPMAIELDESYYGISFGAVCEFEITMESATVINEIALSPYSVFPFELIAIRYTETASEDEQFKEILAYDPENRKILEGSMSVRFKDQICKRIRVLINQINYTNSNNFFDTDTESKKSLFDESVLGQYGPDAEDFNPAVYERVKIQNKAWAMLSQSTNGEEITLDSLIGATGKRVNINKFNYEYGFNNVSCFYNDFRKLGLYVSKPIIADGPIWKVSLETEEEHSSINDKEFSDIEYYVSTDNAGPDSEWLSVFPENKTSVTSEMLIFDEDEVATLRFKVKDISSLVIYQNTMPLAPLFDYSILGNQSIKLLVPKKPNAIYTAAYMPSDDSRLIEYTMLEFDAKEKVKIETSKSELSNSVIPGSSTVVFVDDSGVRYSQAKGEIECVTNTVTPEQSFMNFSSNKLQYYTVDDNIYFNRSIEGTLEVQYKYFNKRLRLKAIFRKNIDNQNWIVPVLKEYKLNFISI